MNVQLLKRMTSLGFVVASIGLMAAACGGDEKCDDGQTLAAINGGAEQCYDQCVDGMCNIGQTCQSGLCVAASATNNTSTNNTSTNNTSTNNTSTNNTSTNNTSTNNTSTNNNTQACNAPVNLGLCEPLCQTGCATDEGCVIGSAGPNAPLMAACQPAGTGSHGAACGETAGCLAGFVCAGDADGSTCQEMCNPSAAACSQAGASCAPLQADQRIGVCVVPMDDCSLFADMCPATQRCFPTTIGLQCIPGGGIAAGAACNENMPQECNAGLYCADVDGPQGPATATCRTLCDTTNATTCTGGQICQQAFQDLPTLGLCINPP